MRVLFVWEHTHTMAATRHDLIGAEDVTAEHKQCSNQQCRKWCGHNYYIVGSKKVGRCGLANIDVALQAYTYH